MRIPASGSVRTSSMRQRLEPVQLGDLGHADRGLVEHAVHARGTVDVRRHLGHEQQRVTHAHLPPVRVPAGAGDRRRSARYRGAERHGCATGSSVSTDAEHAT